VVHSVEEASVAGTPDKSGEHKASGGPAPEDPRLAVSRGVDQETAVFSVRDAAGEDPDTGASAPDPDAGAERVELPKDNSETIISLL